MRVAKIETPSWPRMPAPSRPRFSVSRELLVATTDWLRLASDGRRESTVLWAGRPSGSDLVRVSYIIEPDYAAGALRMNVGVADRAEVLSALRSLDVMVVADLHTHPEEAFLSPVDRQHAYSSRDGHVAIVLPRYATRDPLVNWKAYQVQSGMWVERDLRGLLDVRPF